MVVATGIETQLWNTIQADLRESGWKLKSQYRGFDKGIDFDLYILKKNKEKLLFAWDNWIEGEIKGKQTILITIEAKFDFKFEYGESVHFKPGLKNFYRIFLTR